MAEHTEKLERVHALVEIKRAMRELYFKFDELSDDEAESMLTNIQGSVQTVRAQVQKRKNERANQTPPTPQG